MSVCNADPWQMINTKIEDQHSEVVKSGPEAVPNACNNFEDNFAPPSRPVTHSPVDNNNDEESNATCPLQHLPDSANYLQLLERKLAKVQKGAKLLDSLQEKRQDCMRSLLGSNGVPATTLEQLLELDVPIESGRLQRHLLPVQAVTAGEKLHIIQHDALEDQIEEEKASQ
ncbi:uncharacterized protein LOC115620714 [Scaptodrosophila lebanonensis]|uniref:Uncharacterized protein LOC115620714 n=1 Tax=Drosophila lebanonensis TaxID=7225 RepID=A0A6J2SZD4_DROLE|nr:uncharacterized protein LOC115620714 [Scaptodrosophila lebanonensis]